MSLEHREEKHRRGEGRLSFLARLRRAYQEFLLIPTLVILGFFLLAIGAIYLDNRGALPTLRQFLAAHLFHEPGATKDYLGVLVGSIITVTTVTISILLLALQQAASTLSDQVIVQFLHRRGNRFYFGFFVGLPVYCMVVFSSVTATFNPVISAGLAFLFVMLALYLLMALLYTTISQMQPEVIIEAIHTQTLNARQRQLPLVRRTRRIPRLEGPVARVVKSNAHGYVTHIDFEKIAEAVRQAPGELEVVLLVSFGSFVAYQDEIARILGPAGESAALLESTIRNAIFLEEQRALQFDPAYGIEQYETIAWTSISTSKSNPEPGYLAIRSMRDVLARWLTEEEGDEEQEYPIVYPDNVIARLMDAFESLLVVTSESMQHQNMAEILRTMAVMYGRMPPDLRRRTNQLILRALPMLRRHFMTGELEATLRTLEETLRGWEQHAEADAVREAHGSLQEQEGKLEC